MNNHLPGRVKAGYGLAEIGIMGAEILIRVYLLKFYTDEVGLAPRMAAYAVALGVVVDAVTDPLVGYMSDHWRWGKGRRIPFLPIGALTAATALVLVYNPPELATENARFLYLMGTYIFFNVALTILAVPYAALAGDLSDDAQERMHLFGIRLFCGNLGLVFGTALPGIFAAKLSGNAASGSSFVIGGVIVVTALVSTLVCARYDQPAPPRSVTAKSEKRSWRYMFNRPFIILFLAYFIATLGLTINSSLALYYYSYRLLLDEVAVNLIIACFVFVFCLAIPFWVFLARFQSKRLLMCLGVGGLGVMSIVAYPLFPPGMEHWPYLAAVLGGILVGSVVLLDATLADIVDYDHIWSGEARFGLYFGVWKLGGKMSRALALVLTGHLLALIGFEPNQVQDPEVAQSLAYAFGPGVGVFLILAAVILARFPLNEQRHQRVTRILQHRKQRQSVTH